MTHVRKARSTKFKTEIGEVEETVVSDNFGAVQSAVELDEDKWMKFDRDFRLF